MKETTLRILDILGRELGNPFSIYGLVKKIVQTYGTAYYKQIYDEIQKLEEENSVQIIKSGRTTSPALNFNNTSIIDKLAQIELERKIRFTEKHKEFELLINDLILKLRKNSIIQTIALVNPEINSKLNRAELFIILYDFKTNEEEKELMQIRRFIDMISAQHNIRIDPLFMQEKNFIDLLREDNPNIAKKMMTDKIIIMQSENFWAIIQSMMDKNINISTDEYETNPAKISDEDLIFNLARFGYKEFGNIIKDGKTIRIEYIITALLLQENTRRLEAIPIILAKEESVNYNLLLFLSQKYGTTEKLFGMLKILNQYKHLQGVKDSIRNLTALKTKEIKANLDDLERKMKLYNVIR